MWHLCSVIRCQGPTHSLNQCQWTAPKLRINVNHLTSVSTKEKTISWKIQGCRCFLRVHGYADAICHHWFECSFVQVEPNSIAARDGRIKEGDRILQVCSFFSHQVKSLTTFNYELMCQKNPLFRCFSLCLVFFFLRISKLLVFPVWTSTCIFNHLVLLRKLKSLVAGTISFLALLSVSVLTLSQWKHLQCKELWKTVVFKRSHIAAYSKYIRQLGVHGDYYDCCVHAS